MKKVLVAILALTSLTVFSQKISQDCLERSESVSIFHTGTGIFSAVKYELVIDFWPDSLNFSYTTNHGMDTTIEYDFETLSRVKIELYPFKIIDISTAHENAKIFNTMVKNGILQEATFALSTLVEPENDENKKVLKCAQSRAVALMEKVNNEVILKRNVTVE